MMRLTAVTLPLVDSMVTEPERVEPPVVPVAKKRIGAAEVAGAAIVRAASESNAVRK